MSIELRCKSKINDVNLEILEEVLKIIEEKHKIQIRRHSHMFIISHPEIFMGLCVQVRKGKMNYAFDLVSRPNAMKMIKELEITYMSIVYIKSLKEIGYQVDVKEDNSGVVIEGRDKKEKISVILSKETGEIFTDFEGFVERQCEKAEAKLNACLEKNGLKADILKRNAKPGLPPQEAYEIEKVPCG